MFCAKWCVVVHPKPLSFEAIICLQNDFISEVIYEDPPQIPFETNIK